MEHLVEDRVVIGLPVVEITHLSGSLVDGAVGHPSCKHGRCVHMATVPYRGVKLGEILLDLNSLLLRGPKAASRCSAIDFVSGTR